MNHATHPDARSSGPSVGRLLGDSRLLLPLAGALLWASRRRNARAAEARRSNERLARERESLQNALDVLREQALTDTLTGLGNRRRLAIDLEERIAAASGGRALMLILLDLDGFKSYNDTFGHIAGDAVLARLAGKLTAAVQPSGSAYRLGGDEFCVLMHTSPAALQGSLSAASQALREHGENFAIGASYGAVLIPHEASSLDYALRLADERMYERKRQRPSHVGEQTRDVLMHIIRAKQPSLEDHSGAVASLCLRVGRRLNMTPEQLGELSHAAELHDVGKVGIPDAILEKPDALDAVEWEFIYQHTLLGERILSAAPALRPIAAIVRATHERWDGGGYPDGLAGDAIPLAARVIAACDALEAMTTERSYRKRLSYEAACLEISGQSGTQFDPAVVDALLEELLSDADPARLDEDATDGEHAAQQVAAHLLGVIAGADAPSAQPPLPGFALSPAQAP